jgi:alpha-galactosidase/6-phospho-beta-glucosidase family protein
MSVQNFYCKKCKYGSKNKYNFTQHCETKKHLKNHIPLSSEDTPLSSEDIPLSSEEGKSSKKFTCKYCKSEFLKKNKARHFKLCKIKKETVMGSEIEELRILTNKLQEKLEEKDDIMEKRIQDIEKEMLEFMKSLALANNSNITNNTTNNTKINNNNYNMYYIINNFTQRVITNKSLPTEAENIEDIMASPLTQEELDYIEKKWFYSWQLQIN